MRSDMAKVIVERPRFGSRYKKARKGYNKAQGRCPWDERPKREGIKARTGHDRWLNEHLGPLRRYLHSQVGRPWDKVFSEICAHVSRDSAVQDHVRDHVDDFVETHTVLIDGIPCIGRGHWYGWPVNDPGPFYQRKLLYVCPTSGILKHVRKTWTKRQRRPRKADPRHVRVDASHFCVGFGVVWYLVDVKPLPGGSGAEDGLVPSFSPHKDVVFDKILSAGEARQRYGAAVYGVAKRRLSKREMRQLPIPFDWQK